MDVPMSKVETLVDFSELDEDLTPEQKKAHAESVEVFLEVLRQDATEAGIKAYEAKLEGLPAEEFPWTAVRPRHYWVADASFGDAETRIRRAPPALSLVLARRADLEPELTSDEIPGPGTPAWESLWEALFEWRTDVIRSAITPVGWAPPIDEEAELVLDSADPLVESEDEAEPPTSSPMVPSSSSSEASTTSSATSMDQPNGDDGALAKRVLLGAGVVAGLGVAGSLVYYLTRPRPSYGASAGSFRAQSG
ncbi:MAG: hypothetical protein R3A51_24030, partial [Nannocystaceae bacterium]